MRILHDQNKRAWFCLRSHPKHEHIASANLKRLPELEVFCPRLRSRKLTRRGPVWMTESLFPNYLFARFELARLLDFVRYTPGVNQVIQFAGQYPVIPDETLEELKQTFGSEEVQISDLPQEGDKVLIAEQSFFGMEAVVFRVLPAKQRVQVLIEMLGRANKVELPMHAVVAAAQPIEQFMLRSANVSGMR
jgi:transcriptional antiterminator RfaH